MEHTRISKKKFEEELSKMVIFSERGGKLGALAGTYRCWWEETLKDHDCEARYRFSLGSLNGTSLQSDGHVHLEFGRGHNRDVLVRPVGIVLPQAVRVAWFTPEQTPESELPEEEAATFGESRVGDELADNLPSAKIETLALANLLRAVCSAIERSVVAS